MRSPWCNQNRAESALGNGTACATPVHTKCHLDLEAVVEQKSRIH